MNKGGPAISNGWRFSSEAYPDSHRADAWREAVGRLGLTAASSDIDVGFHGTVTAQSSPLGVMFAQIAFTTSRFLRSALPPRL